VNYTSIYLNSEKGTLEADLPKEASQIRYSATKGENPDRAGFTYRFSKETELTGTMGLKLWVSTSDGTDLDLFAKLRKFDASGREVFFYGYNGFDRDGVAKGWLRVSHRAIDEQKSRPGMPWHSHLKSEAVQPNEIVPVEIEILASSTLFETGSVLQLDVLGHDADRYPAFKHHPTVNRGWHTIYTGAAYDSQLMMPVVGGIVDQTRENN
jgi:uncharacterized protein